MAYAGKIANLPLGNGGLHTDDPQNKVPATDLIRAINVQYYNGLLEKEAGSIRFNSNVLPSGVIGVNDWWPNEITQRMIAVCRNGKIYRFTLGSLTFSEVMPSDTSLAAITADEQVHLVAGGNETTMAPRKLFIFSQSTPQVISGDGTTRRMLTAPALDWTGPNQPYFALVHRSRVFAFMGHTCYASAATDHEDFQSGNSLVFPCYSGEGEKIINALVYKGALFVVKFPNNVYQFIDTDPDPTNWYFTKINSELGGASTHCSAPIINDVLIANANGSISSATAVLAFGNLKTGEVLYILRNENFMRDETSQQGLSKRHCVYYSDKKLFLATYQSAGGIKNDMMLVMDMTNPQLYKVSWSTKDQANCLALQKDYLGVKRPIYGSDDGYIYIMDRPDRLVGEAGYQFDCQTPHIDFGFLDPGIADQNKLFDFLELDFEPTGDFDLEVDIHIDGRYKKTITYNLSGSANLDSFILDENNLDPEALPESRKPINLSGRRISFRLRNDGAGENVRLAGLNVYFRLSAQQPSAEARQ